MTAGSLESLGGDRWRLRAYFQIDGKARQRSRSFRAGGKRAAERKAAGIYRQLESAAQQEGRHAGTVADLSRRWLAAGKWSPSTRKGYERMANTVKTDLGKIKLDHLSPLQVDEWYAKLEGRGLSARSVLHHRAVLRMMLRRGYKWGIVPNLRAVEASTPPSAVTHEVRPPTDDVVRLLLSTSTGWLRTALLLSLHTGARRGEVVGLRWSDFQGGTLTIQRSALETKSGVIVKPPKSGKSREIPVSADVLAELAQHRANTETVLHGQGADWFVFPDWRKDRTGNTPKRPDWLSHAWARHRKLHGANNVRLHDLRHWHATALIGRGLSIPAASKRLGHAQVSTTLNIYAHTLNEEDQRAPELIAGALGPAQVG